MPKSQIISASITDGTIANTDIADSTLTTAKLATSNLGRRNLIINGTGIVNQRGTNTTINTYGPDRWRSYGGPGAFTFSSGSTAGAGEGDTYAIKFQRTSGNSQTNAMGITQGLESINSKHLAGKTLTLSFRVRRGSNWNIGLNYNVYAGTGTDENPVGMTNLATQFAGTIALENLTTSWQTVTLSGNIGSDRTQVSVAFSWTPTGTAGANEYIEIREVQLEIGSQATPFEHRSFGEELTLCQRYYQQSYAHGTAAGTATTVGRVIRFVDATQSYAGHWITFRAEMRAAPTGIPYNVTTGTINQMRDDNGNHAAVIGQSATHGMHAYCNNASVGTSESLNLHYTADAEL